jgi:hypothetical protein
VFSFVFSFINYVWLTVSPFSNTPVALLSYSKIVNVITVAILVITDNVLNIMMVRLVLKDSKMKSDSITPEANLKKKSNKKIINIVNISSIDANKDDIFINSSNINNDPPSSSPPPLTEIVEKSTERARKRRQLTLVALMVMVCDVVAVIIFYGETLFSLKEGSNERIYMKGLAASFACGHVICCLLLLLELKNNASAKAKVKNGSTLADLLRVFLCWAKCNPATSSSSAVTELSTVPAGSNNVPLDYIGTVDSRSLAVSVIPLDNIGPSEASAPVSGRGVRQQNKVKLAETSVDMSSGFMESSVHERD